MGDLASSTPTSASASSPPPAPPRQRRLDDRPRGREAALERVAREREPEPRLPDVAQRRLAVEHAAAEADEQRDDAARRRVLVPDHDVREDREELVHHAHERVRRRRRLGPAPPAREADARADDARESEQQEPRGLDVGRARGEPRRLAVGPDEEEHDGRRERVRVVGRAPDPRLHVDRVDDELAVRHLRRDDDQIKRRPRVRAEAHLVELRVLERVRGGARDDDGEREPRPRRRQVALEERGVQQRDRRGRQAPEDDDRLDVGVLERLHVREEREREEDHVEEVRHHLVLLERVDVAQQIEDRRASDDRDRRDDLDEADRRREREVRQRQFVDQQHRRAKEAVQDDGRPKRDRRRRRQIAGLVDRHGCAGAIARCVCCTCAASELRPVSADDNAGDGCCNLFVLAH
mmetsp:Transcript_8870/g.27723  ORF Transcript_8870/g.27723 Transcript_8870/m.27723 type:complete len:407 (+) Transcript_8870:3-1223(+)